jgi:hypothetical protein
MTGTEGDYEDFLNRFEDWIELSDEEFETEDELYDVLHSWLGIKRTGEWLPSQNQMNVFTEHYGLNDYPVRARIERERDISEATPLFEYKDGSFYNPATKEFAKFVTQHEFKHSVATERIYNFSYGRRIVLVDDKTGKILAHKYDLTNEKELGSQI